MDKELLTNRTLNILPLGCLRSVYETICKDILRNSKSYLDFQKTSEQLFQFLKIQI